MDYYQGVVCDYLRADRALFLNTECCIQLNEAANPDSSGPHWFCDAIAVDFRCSTVYLCEVSYARSLGALLKRLAKWNDLWPGVCAALARDCRVPSEWPVRPWLFIPEGCIPMAVARIWKLRDANESAMPIPRITTLEMVAPWIYTSWNRVSEREKPSSIPQEMRV